MITFPIMLEDIISTQDQLVGRELPEFEKETIAVWIDVFNLSYEAGLEKDRAALEDLLVKMDELLKKREGAALNKCLRLARQWIIYAWEQGAGKEAAQ